MCAQIGLASVLRRVRGIRVEELHGDVLIAPEGTDNFFALDGVGARIWQLLDHPISVSDLCSHLMNEYTVDAGQCRQHVVEFLTELEKEKLICQTPES